MPSGSQMQSSQQAQRLKAFRELLDPADLLPGHNVADLYKLRHLCLQGGGLPEGTSTSSASTPASSSFAASRSSDAWLRAQAWRVLLGYLPPEKLEWKQVLNKRRGEYYQFVADFLPSSQDVSGQHGFPGKLSERDALLDQIYRDLSRSRKNAFSFYRAPVEPSRSCPLTPAPASAQGEQATPRLEQRLSLLHRLASINADYADSLAREALSRRPGTPSKASTLHSHLSPPNMARTRSNGRGRAPAAKSPSIVLEPASPGTSEGPSEYFEEEDDSGFVSAEDNSHPSPPLVPRKDHHDGDRTSEDAIVDRRWHSLLRILYIYALLNPSIGYVQGMNEVLFVILYVMGTSSHLPSAAAASPTAASDAEQTEEEDATESLRYVEDSIDSPIAHAEADAFWCFSALIGQVRDLYDFDGVDYGTAGLRISNRGTSEEAPHLDDSGMAGALKRFSLRLKWLDEDLWRSMRIHSLDPRMPYYSFRWLACLISTELSLPSVVRVWDAILSETNEPTGIPGSSTAKVEFLIDVCCALLIHVRGQILDAIEEGEDDGDDQHDSFSRTMAVLQAYPDGDVGPILELASLYRQRRMAAPLTGDGPPTEDDEEAILTMRQRAARAVRGWTATSTPSRPRWLSSPRQAPFESPSSSSAVSTPSRSPGAVLQRYADALQSSDAAASLSKASTNWTAKAMATWGERGSGERAGRDASPSPVNTDGSRTTLSLQSLFSKARSPSTSSTSAQSQASNSPSQSVHPALRWSRDGMPDLPIPNVEDSPVGSQEYGYGKRPISTLLGRASGGTGTGTGTGAGSSSPSNSTSGSPMNSPTLASSGRFGTLPSLQAGLRQTSKSSAGPKPLLLRTAARPPREGSNNGSVEPEEQSRIVSSGPLAARNGRRHRAAGASTERRGSGTASVTSSAMDGASESGGESNSFSAASASVNATVPRSVAPASTSLLGDGDEAGADVTSSTGGGGRGTVPVSAFSKIRTSNNGDLSIDSDEVSSKPAFGQVASSADQPLNQKKPSLQRGIRRKDSKEDGSSAASASNHSSLTGSINGQQGVLSGSVDWQSPRGSGTGSSSTTSDSSVQDKARTRPDSVFEHPRAAPAPPIKEEAPIASSSPVTPVGDVNRYELSDEPAVATVSAKPLAARTPSGSGIVRNKRTFSSKRGSKRTTGDDAELGALTVNTSAADGSGASSALPSPGPGAGETMTSAELLARLESSTEDEPQLTATPETTFDRSVTGVSEHFDTPRGGSGRRNLESSLPNDVSPVGSDYGDHEAFATDDEERPFQDGGEEAFQAIGNALALADDTRA